MRDSRTLDTRRSDAFAARIRVGHLTCLCGFPDCQPPSDTENTENTENTEDTDTGQDEPNDSSDTEPDDTDSTTTESATSSDRPSDSTTGGGNCDCGRPFASDPGSTTGPQPNTSATKPLIHITANLETILGLQSRAAYLHGYGHLDPTTLRTLAQDATWQVIFTVGRKYLDALTTSARCSVPDPPPDTESADSPHCTCSCTCCAQPRPGATADLLNQAAAEHDAVASMLPSRMTTPTPEQRADDRRRRANQDSPDLTVGRTRPLAAGHVPAPPPPDPDAPPPITAGILADHYKKLIETDPARTNAEYPDGHGGHTTPPPGALRYTPNAALSQRVRAQYPTCRYPGCTVRSSRCDLDHIVEFDHKNPEQGGWTISSNLGPFCRTHHNLKTSRLWPTEKLADDVLHITDPHGNHYFSPPEL